MGRLAALTPHKVIRLLKKHGFVEARQTGSHLVLRHPDSGRMAVVPVHAYDIPRETLMTILKHAGIRIQDD